ncbi:MAG: phage tail spike protein [Clostridium perfringens]|nr:phage tail spike protein [Clostridium perfringens]
MDIQVYNWENTNFEFNGDRTLCPYSCELIVRLNGICEIELEHPYDLDKSWTYLETENVIAAPTPWSDKQLFRIYDFEKTITGLKVYARHIYFDSAKYNIESNLHIKNKNGQEALNLILKNTPFKAYSNITDINDCYFFKNNVIEGIAGNKENCFLNRWGGELFLDNYNIHINYKIGSDEGIRVSYGNNLEDLSLKRSTEGVFTRLYPYVIKNTTDTIELPEKFVDSKNISKYPNIYEKYINLSEFMHLKNGDDDKENAYETLDQLYTAMRDKCREIFAKGIDTPKTSGTVNMAILENTTEYEHVKELVHVNLGDDIIVEHYDIGVESSTRCVGYRWNCITKKYLKIDLGELEKDFFDFQSSTTHDLNNILNLNGTVNPSMLEGIISATKTKFTALRDVAQPQHQLAMLFEDRIKGSKTYGACAIGSMGLMIASKRLPDDSDWDWNTFIGGGFAMADWLIGKLKTVLIENMDGSFQMDLNKPGGMLFKNNGKDAIKIERNMVQLFNWKKNGDYIGALMSLIRGDDENKPILGLANTISSALTIGYEEKDSNKVPSYLEFDKYNILKDKNNKPVRVYEDIDFKNRNLYSAVLSSLNDKCYIYNNDEKTVIKHEDVTIKLEKGKITLDGDVVLNGVIKNTSGNLVLDPNAPQGGGVDGSDSLRNSVVNSARKLIGKPYVWGGNYPPLGSDVGTDCSGLMQWAYNDNGIKISRTTYTQIKEGIEVSEAELKPSDLIFLRFSSPGVPEHVFMYSGKKNGKHMCVEAPRTGLNIREIEFTWGSNYRARRIIKDTPGGNTNGPVGAKASKNIIYYVKGIEGYAPYHYYDSVGVKTLGYGMTGKELNGVSVPLSETSATHYLVNNFNNLYYVPVLNMLKARGATNMLQREVDALASFAYNCGLGSNGLGGSQLLKKYVAGERGESIHNEFKKWVHGGGEVLPGLVRRREEEWKIFSGSSSLVGGYNTAPSISYINKAGLPTSKLVTENGGYGASPY